MEIARRRARRVNAGGRPYLLDAIPANADDPAVVHGIAIEHAGGTENGDGTRRSRFLRVQAELADDQQGEEESRLAHGAPRWCPIVVHWRRGSSLLARL